MTESGTHEPRRAVRLTLLATGAGLLWAAVALFAPADAHAAEGDAGGLVGIVSEVTGGAAGLVGSMTETVADVAPPVAPVTTAVSQTVNATVGTVDNTVQSVPAIVPPATPVVAPVVTEVLQPVVDHVVQPVIDTVATTTAPVPVVGELVGAVDLSGTVAAVPGATEAVDTIVDIVLEGPILGGALPIPDSSMLPPVSDLLGLTGLTIAGDTAGAFGFPTLPDAAVTSSAARTFISGLDVVLVEDAAVVGAGRETAPTDVPDSPWPSDSAPGSGSSANSVSGSASAALHFSTFGVEAALSSVSAHTASDRLPACPVFEADTSPD